MSTPQRNGRRQPVVQPAESPSQTTSAPLSPTAVLEPPKKSHPRLGIKAPIAQALMRSGISMRNTAKALSISQNTACELKQEDIISPEHIERIKKQLEKDEVLKRQMILDSITPQVIAKANLVQRTTSYKHLKSDAAPSIQTQMNVIFNKYDGHNTQSVDVTPHQTRGEH